SLAFGKADKIDGGLRRRKSPHAVFQRGGKVLAGASARPPSEIQNIPLTYSKNQNISASARATKGTFRDRHGTWCGLRWTLQASGRLRPAGRSAGSVGRSRVVLAPRPWRYVGGNSRWQRGQERPLPRGEHV